MPKDRVLYIFLDEAGEINDFSPRGTKYFSLGALYLVRPFTIIPELAQLKYDLWEEGLEFEYFHATEDRQVTRDRVFNILTRNLALLRFRTIIVEKRKTNPSLWKDKGLFYQKILDVLLRYIIRGKWQEFRRIIIVTDKIPIQNKRRAIEGAIKESLSGMATLYGGSYKIYHYQCKSDINLQIADYLNWAVSQKWEDGDERSYALIRGCVLSEFEIFKNGNTVYY